VVEESLGIYGVSFLSFSEPPPNTYTRYTPPPGRSAPQIWLFWARLSILRTPAGPLSACMLQRRRGRARWGLGLRWVRARGGRTEAKRVF